jgi:hypothetical protein
MTHDNTARPLAVWLISMMLGLVAVLNIAILSSFLVSGSANPAMQNALASLPVFDRVMFYLLSGILLTSMVYLFRLRKRAISWFVVYIGLGSLVALAYSLAPAGLPYFNELVSLGGLGVALAILAYMLRLRRQHALI